MYVHAVYTSFNERILNIFLKTFMRLFVPMWSKCVF